MLPPPTSRLLPALLSVLLLAQACGSRRARLIGESLDGETIDLLEGDPAAVVLVFVTPDCPISNRYAPEIARLTESFGEEGVRTYLVYPDPAFDVEDIRRHVADYSLPARPVLDPTRALVEHTGAEVTPEAALLLPSGEVAYRGRIDDRFVDFGKTRPRATEHDLRDAVTAVLAGRAVATPRSRAVGCYIPPLES